MKAGEKAEFRVHSVEPYQLELWRYGLAEGARPQPRLVRRARSPGHDADHARWRLHPDGRGLEQVRLRQPPAAPVRRGARAIRALLLPRPNRPGAEFSFPWIVAPEQPTAPVAVLASNITWNAYNNFGGRSNYINPDRLPPTPTVNARLELKRYTDPGRNHLRHRRLRPALVRPAGADQPHRRARGDHRPDRGPGRVPHRAGRVAAARLARARAVHLRLLRRDPAPRRHARPRRVPGADPLDPPGILVARRCTSRSRRWVNERGGRLMYLGGNGHQLRGRVRRTRRP